MNRFKKEWKNNKLFRFGFDGLSRVIVKECLKELDCAYKYPSGKYRTELGKNDPNPIKIKHKTYTLRSGRKIRIDQSFVLHRHWSSYRKELKFYEEVKQFPQFDTTIDDIMENCGWEMDSRFKKPTYTKILTHGTLYRESK